MHDVGDMREIDFSESTWMGMSINWESVLKKKAQKQTQLLYLQTNKRLIAV